MRFDKNALLLYAVTDRSWLRGQTLREQAEESLRGGVTMLQLREKELDDQAFLDTAYDMKALCNDYKVPFIINDNVPVALACGADGVHVGQSDTAAAEARRLLGPDKILGVSVQTVGQAVLADQNGADYLGVGAIFPTASKSDADDVALETLKAICGAVTIPVVAIGGINRHNIRRLKSTGISGVAVISAIYAEKDIQKAARELLALSQETVGL